MDCPANLVWSQKECLCRYDPDAIRPIEPTGNNQSTENTESVDYSEGKRQRERERERERERKREREREMWVGVETQGDGTF